MKWIGITGGIATGKSTVSRMIQDLGMVVLDADVFAREVVDIGTYGISSLVQLFGKSILDSEGKLNRSQLGKIIFENEGERLVLERTLHPLIQWRAAQERGLLLTQGVDYAFYDAALIYEKQMENRFSKIIVVTANEDIQIQRLMKRNGVTKVEAEKRIKAQWPVSKKAEFADFIIDNNGTLDSTKKQVRDVLMKIKN